MKSVFFNPWPLCFWIRDICISESMTSVFLNLWHLYFWISLFFHFLFPVVKAGAASRNAPAHSIQPRASFALWHSVSICIFLSVFAFVVLLSVLFFICILHFFVTDRLNVTKVSQNPETFFRCFDKHLSPIDECMLFPMLSSNIGNSSLSNWVCNLRLYLYVKFSLYFVLLFLFVFVLWTPVLSIQPRDETSTPF